MAKSDPNGEYVTLASVRVHYNSETKRLELTSGDPELKGQDFVVAIRPGSPEDAALKRVLITHELISRDELVNTFLEATAGSLSVLRKLVKEKKTRAKVALGDLLRRVNSEPVAARVRALRDSALDRFGHTVRVTSEEDTASAV